MESNQRVREGSTSRQASLDAAGGAEGVPEAVIARACAGDEDAWREIVSRYARRLYALVASRLRDRTAAEEVVQGVFATAAIKLRDGGYAEQGRFEAWLFRVAGNRIRDEVRRRRRAPTVEVLSSDGPTADHGHAQSPDHAQLAGLRDAMDELSEQDREVIELRHHGGMGFKQIAELLDEPVGTLLARHHRALRKLRSILERGEPRGDDA